MFYVMTGPYHWSGVGGCCLLFNVNSAIIHLYHDKNKLVALHIYFANYI